MNRNVRRSRHNAFTLIELLLVMVILVVLAGIVLPKFVGRGKDAKITAAKADLASMKTALTAFEVDNQRFPTDDEGLVALLSAPSGLTDWKGPYLDTNGKKDAPKDPWGTPYVYHYPGTHNTDSYDLASLGEDAREGNDDIANWQ